MNLIFLKKFYDLGPDWGAMAGASVQATGDIWNAIQTGLVNKKNREFAREMYGTQRQDALSDWHMQNAYNAPDQQMARLKAAGLNPNLVYGPGSVANNASSPRASSVQSGNAQAARINPGAAMMMYTDINMKNTQMDNLQEMRKLIQLKQMEALGNVDVKKAQVGKMLVDTHRGQFELDLRSGSKEYLQEQIRLNAEQTKANVKYTLDQNERAALQNVVSLSKAAEEILSIRLGRAKTQAEIDHIKQQIQNLKTDQGLKELEKKWMEEGKTKGDWYFWRFLNDALGNEPGKNLGNKIRSKLLGGYGDPE